MIYAEISVYNKRPVTESADTGKVYTYDVMNIIKETKSILIFFISTTFYIMFNMFPHKKCGLCLKFNDVKIFAVIKIFLSIRRLLLTYFLHFTSSIIGLLSSSDIPGISIISGGGTAS